LISIRKFYFFTDREKNFLQDGGKARGEKQDFCTSEVQKYRQVPRSTKKYREVPRSTKNSQEVPRSTKKYKEVQRSTEKYREVRKKYLFSFSFFPANRTKVFCYWEMSKILFPITEHFVLFLRLKLLTYSHKSIVKCREVRRRSTKKYREVQRSTKKYREVQRSTEKYEEVRRSTEKYEEVQRSTEKYEEVQRSTEVCFFPLVEKSLH
jgi:hypothetical protein